MLVDLDAEWTVGEGGYESRSENCCFAGRHAARQGPADGRRRRGRLPRALDHAERLRERLESRLERLRPARGRHPLRRRRLRRAASAATGEVVFTTGMSGYQESVTDPSFAAPDHHVHLPAHRQLRRLRRGDGVRPRLGARGDHARGDQHRGRAGRRARLAATGCATAAIPAITERRHARARAPHPRRRARCAAASSRRRSARREARELIAAEPPMAGLDLARDRDARASDRPRLRRRARGSRRSTPASRPRSSATSSQRGAIVELHPCTSSADELLARDPDAIFLANGPGDPAALDYIVETCASSSASGRCAASASATSCCAARSAWRLQAALRPPRRQPPGQGPARPGSIEITSQNHGFAVARPAAASGRSTPTSRCAGRPTSAPPQLSHINLYDRTVEGLTLLDVAGAHGPVPPRGGPRPERLACYLFDRSCSVGVPMPRRDDIQRILILGSGPIVIGQAAEFDYSGVQACKVLGRRATRSSSSTPTRRRS